MAPSFDTSAIVRLGAGDPETWQCFVELFGPLIYRWCRAAGLAPADAADVGQEVLMAAAVGLARRGFDRGRGSGSLTAWLRVIAASKIADHWRQCAGEPRAAGGSSAQQRLAEIPDPEEVEASIATVRGGRLRHAAEAVRAGCEPRSWDAFWKTAVDGRPPADVAAELGLSLGAVYTARSRLARALRDRYGDLLETDA